MKMNGDTRIYTTYDSPIGTLVMAARSGRIFSVRIVDSQERLAPSDAWQRDDTALEFARAQLASYFAGSRTEFDLPLALEGTPFQMLAWKALQRVRFGETTTYKDLARSIGAPRAARAVGLAMNRNPITLVIPCHRVIGSDGRLRGYLNGVDIKRRLLDFEAAACGRIGEPLVGEHSRMKSCSQSTFPMVEAVCL